MTRVRDLAPPWDLHRTTPTERDLQTIHQATLAAWPALAVPAVFLTGFDTATIPIVLGGLCLVVSFVLFRVANPVQRIGTLLALALLIAALAGRIPLLSVSLGGLLVVQLTPSRDTRQFDTGLATSYVGMFAVVALLQAPTGRTGTALALQLVAVTLNYMDLPLLSSVRSLGKLVRRSIHRVAHALGLCVGSILRIAVGLLLLLLPWLVNSCLRLDPLSSRSADHGWLKRRRPRTRPHSTWLRDQESSRAGVLLSVRRGGAAVIQLGIVGLLLVSVLGLMERTDSVSNNVPAAVDVPWWPDYQEIVAWINTPGTGGAYDPIGPNRINDVSSPLINVDAGRRRTWNPGSCDGCPELTVWLYGGSTSFGIGQRDDFTIASQIAKLAYERGIRLKVENRGMLADLHWEEAQRFAWDAALEPPPDLVLFLDGTNEIWSSSVMNEEGLGGELVRWNPETENARRIHRELVDDAPGFMDHPKPSNVESESLTDPPGTVLDMDSLSRATIDRYELARESSAATAERHGTEALWFWQPCADTAEPVEGESGYTGKRREQNSALCEGTSALLPDQVIDLTHALDDRTKPLFFDPFHTNELGARLTAERIMDHAGGVLSSLAAGTAGT